MMKSSSGMNFKREAQSSLNRRRSTDTKKWSGGKLWRVRVHDERLSPLRVASSPELWSKSTNEDSEQTHKLSIQVTVPRREILI